MKIHPTEGQCIDWAMSLNVYAVNAYNHIVENATEMCKDEVIILHKNYDPKTGKGPLVDEDEVSHAIDVHGCEVEYILYAMHGHVLVGFVLANDVED